MPITDAIKLLVASGDPDLITRRFLVYGDSCGGFSTYLPEGCFT